MAKLDRPSSVSGMFYPSDPPELRRNVQELLAAVPRKGEAKKVRGIIGPHAGYVYSGSTAAHAYAMLEGAAYDSVVIVSPSHREYFDGVSVFPGRSYVTPLGSVPVDAALREALLRECSIAVASDAGHRLEHAVEVHLPFLQCVLGEFSLLPVVVGDQRREYCFSLGEALGRILAGKNALLVASTDLSHYYPSSMAQRLDGIVVEDVSRFDYEQLMRDLESQRAEACGGGPAVAVMLALSRLGVNRMEVLHHCNSGDVTGERNQVVGYLAAAAYA